MVTNPRSPEIATPIIGTPGELRKVSFLFNILGIGLLLPWNVFISAQTYFHSRFCSSSIRWIGENFESTFGIVGNVSFVLALLVAMIPEWKKSRNGRAPTENETSPLQRQSDQPLRRKRLQVIVPFVIYFLVFSLHTVLLPVTSLSSTAFYAFTIASLAIAGAASAIGGAELTSQAAIYPDNKGTTSFFAGQSISGLLVTVANFVLVLADGAGDAKFRRERCNGDTRLLSGEGNASCVAYEINMVSLIYFIWAMVCVLACLWAYRVLQGSPVTVFYQTHGNRSRENGTDDYGKDVMEGGDLNADPLLPDVIEPQSAEDYCLDSNTDVSADDYCLDSNTDVPTPPLSHSSVACPALSIFLIFTCTLTIFPGLIGTLHSKRECESASSLLNNSYISGLFVVYNVFEYLGRITVPLFLPRPNLSRSIFVASIARNVIFLPLFLLCDSLGDAYTLILLSLMAFSHGVLATACFVDAAMISERKEASTLMNLCMGAGLLIGSSLSFFYVGFGSDL